MQFDRRYFINMDTCPIVKLQRTSLYPGRLRQQRNSPQRWKDCQMTRDWRYSNATAPGKGLLRRIQFGPCTELSLNLAHPVAQTGRAGSGSIDTGISDL